MATKRDSSDDSRMYGVWVSVTHCQIVPCPLGCKTVVQNINSLYEHASDLMGMPIINLEQLQSITITNQMDADDEYHVCCFYRRSNPNAPHLSVDNYKVNNLLRKVGVAQSIGITTPVLFVAKQKVTNTISPLSLQEASMVTCALQELRAFGMTPTPEKNAFHSFTSIVFGDPDRSQFGFDNTDAVWHRGDYLSDDISERIPSDVSETRKRELMSLVERRAPKIEGHGQWGIMLYEDGDPYLFKIKDLNISGPSLSDIMSSSELCRVATAALASPKMRRDKTLSIPGKWVMTKPIPRFSIFIKQSVTTDEDVYTAEANPDGPGIVAPVTGYANLLVCDDDSGVLQEFESGFSGHSFHLTGEETMLKTAATADCGSHIAFVVGDWVNQGIKAAAAAAASATPAPESRPPNKVMVGLESMIVFDKSEGHVGARGPVLIIGYAEHLGYYGFRKLTARNIAIQLHKHRDFTPAEIEAGSDDNEARTFGLFVNIVHSIPRKEVFLPAVHNAFGPIEYN